MSRASRPQGDRGDWGDRPAPRHYVRVRLDHVLEEWPVGDLRPGHEWTGPNLLPEGYYFLHFERPAPGGVQTWDVPIPSTRVLDSLVSGALADALRAYVAEVGPKGWLTPS